MGDGLLDHARRGPPACDREPTFDLREREHLRGVARVDEANAARGTMSSPYSCAASCPFDVQPDGVKERDVVRVDELLRRCSGELAETDCEHGGAHRVLERLPGTEVGRERECTNHLGSADRPLA